MTSERETALLATVPDGLFIGGEWRTAEAAATTLDVHDPATGALIKQVADASPADGVAVLDAAVDTWAVTPARERPLRPDLMAGQGSSSILITDESEPWLPI